VAEAKFSYYQTMLPKLTILKLVNITFLEVCDHNSDSFVLVGRAKDGILLHACFLFFFEGEPLLEV